MTLCSISMLKWNLHVHQHKDGKIPRALSSVYLPVKRLSFVVNCPEIFLVTFIIAASSSLMNELEEVIFFFGSSFTVSFSSFAP